MSNFELTGIPLLMEKEKPSSVTLNKATRALNGRSEDYPFF